ncbi:MAG: hypothetical protein ACKO24_03855 [Leptolyngbyaceae cyanobacterium]
MTTSSISGSGASHQKPGFLQRWWAIAPIPDRTPVSQTPAIALQLSLCKSG